MQGPFYVIIYSQLIKQADLKLLIWLFQIFGTFKINLCILKLIWLFQIFGIFKINLCILKLTWLFQIFGIFKITFPIVS